MKVFVAGHTGMVGSALVRAIEDHKDYHWIGATRAELDLLDRNAVIEYLSVNKPDCVVIAAARVGGILANQSFPVEFLSENLQLQTNLIDASHLAGVRRLIFLGSSCIYPKDAPQPISEKSLLTGLLEPTNEPYALAKITGLKLVQAYRRQFGHDWISLMPTNLYGPGDNYDPERSHVIPGLISKFTRAKTENLPVVSIWGSGTPLREFLHVDDLASAILFAIGNYSGDEPLNIGSGEEVSIANLASRIARLVGFTGRCKWDETMPDGTPRKLLDSGKIRSLGWRPAIVLDEGLERTVSEQLC